MIDRHQLKHQAHHFVKKHKQTHPHHKLREHLVSNHYPQDIVEEVLEEEYYAEDIWKYRGIILLTVILISIVVLWLAPVLLQN